MLSAVRVQRLAVRPRLIQQHFARLSTQSPPAATPAFPRFRKAVKYTALFGLSSVFGVLAIGGGIFLHDAFTYSDKHVDRVPVSPLALHPECGGPKNLPIVRVFVGDEEDEETKLLAEKPKLVIVGAGWGVCD